MFVAVPQTVFVVRAIAIENHHYWHFVHIQIHTNTNPRSDKLWVKKNRRTMNS